MNGIPVLLALIGVLAAIGFFLSSRAAKVALAARVAEDERLRAELEATRKALQRAGLTLDQIGLIELNEAFAVQSLAVMQ